MFGLVRTALRAFVLGVVVGVLFAPRAGGETRRMLNERFTSFVNQLLEIAALPPIEPTRAHTNGHPESLATRRARASEGSSARTTK
jgi:hypothetical protein